MLAGIRGGCFPPVMPLVQLDLSDELTERIDALAAADLRVRKHEVLALLMEAVEAREAFALASMASPMTPNPKTRG